MAFKFTTNLLSLGAILVLSALYLHFTTPGAGSQREDFTVDHSTLFAERVGTCPSLSPILYDRTASKNEYMLCQLGYSRYCKRRSPVEEQENFYVVCPIYSVNQYNNYRIYKLHTNFKHYCETLGVKFIQLEYAFPYQDFIITEAGKEPFDIQIPGRNIFYLRENLVNVAEQKMPQDYEYISWIDAHVHFDNPYIFQESIVQLGKVNVVAPHTIVRNKDPQNRTVYSKEYAFVYQATYHNSTPVYETHYNHYPFYGLAFMTTKEIFKKINGLPDTCVAGICDMFMSLALTDGHAKIPRTKAAKYDQSIIDWTKYAAQQIEGKYAYIKSTITHLDHMFPFRTYSAWGRSLKLLEDRNFDPYTDLKKDKNGTLYFDKNFELAYDFWKMYAAL